VNVHVPSEEKTLLMTN